MNITKKLHDELTECGFLFPKKNLYQAEGLLTKVEFYFLDQWQTILIRNNDKTTLKDVIGILIDKAFESGVEKGIKKGKKEVGTYLKNLIEE